MPTTKLKLGVELEVEVKDNPEPLSQHVSSYTIYGSYPKHQSLGKTHKKNGNLVKIVDELCGDKIKTYYDNTVEGFEWVGEPMTFLQNMDAWDKVLSHPGIAPYIHGDDVKATNHTSGYFHDAGMHVHVSGEKITPLVLGKVLEFINSTKNKNLIEYVAGRHLNQFCGTNAQYTRKVAEYLFHTLDCVKTTKRGKKIAHTPNHSLDVFADSGFGGYCCNNGMKSAQLGINNRGAVCPSPILDAGDFEVRIFKSTTKLEKFRVNLEFCVAMVDFCLESDEVDVDTFSEWISKKTNAVNYRSLFKYLRTGGFAKGLLPKAIAA